MTILKACVDRMKAAQLTGKARDDAADHFIAGAKAALSAAERAEENHEPLPTLEIPTKGGYLAVLEALATAD